MGLDITAYRQLQPAPHAKVDEDGNPEEWGKYTAISPAIIAYTEEHFPGRTAGLAAGVYSFAEEHGFRAGSYGGYNQWRNWLSIAAGHGSARSVWDDGKTEGPFLELINFSDCEGVIGPQVAAKLAKDFADNESAILKGDHEVWFVKLYREWRKAFEMAADGGCVDFH